MSAIGSLELPDLVTSLTEDEYEAWLAADEFRIWELTHNRNNRKEPE